MSHVGNHAKEYFNYSSRVLISIPRRKLTTKAPIVDNASIVGPLQLDRGANTSDASGPDRAAIEMLPSRRSGNEKPTGRPGLCL